jgi:hypothetical protein
MGRALSLLLLAEGRLRGFCAQLWDQPSVAVWAKRIEAGIRRVTAEAGVPVQHARPRRRASIATNGAVVRAARVAWILPCHFKPHFPFHVAIQKPHKSPIRQSAAPARS